MDCARVTDEIILSRTIDAIPDDVELSGARENVGMLKWLKIFWRCVSRARFGQLLSWAFPRHAAAHLVLKSLIANSAVGTGGSIITKYCLILSYISASFNFRCVSACMLHSCGRLLTRSTLGMRPLPNVLFSKLAVDPRESTMSCAI